MCLYTKFTLFDLECFINKENACFRGHKCKYGSTSPPPGSTLHEDKDYSLIFSLHMVNPFLHIVGGEIFCLDANFNLYEN